VLLLFFLRSQIAGVMQVKFYLLKVRPSLFGFQTLKKPIKPILLFLTPFFGKKEEKPVMAETATIKPQYEKADELFKNEKFQETYDLLKTFEVIGRFYFVESHCAIILFFIRINPIRKLCGGVGGLCTRLQRIAAPKTLK
jgi:hypothetical protein